MSIGFRVRLNYKSHQQHYTNKNRIFSAQQLVEIFIANQSPPDKILMVSLSVTPKMKVPKHFYV